MSAVDFGFVVGNGNSRLGFDLNYLRKFKPAPIWGCNAIYRDYKDLDMVVALDNRMVLELSQNYEGKVAKFSKNRKHAIIDNQLVDWVIPKNNTKAGNWYTGIAALWMFCKNYPNIKTVYMLGFDFYESKTNNIYKGTLNYESTGLNNEIQFASLKANVFEQFPEKHFYRVGVEEDEFPSAWDNLQNIEFVSYPFMRGKLISTRIRVPQTGRVDCKLPIEKR